MMTNEINKAADIIKIPRRVLGTLLNAYAAGVVPRFGLEYIAIGRSSEIGAFLSDFDAIASGMGTFRFVIGKYGSGKSFLIGLVRCNALERNFITADCDLSPERRFHGSKGQGLAAFRELMKNLGSKSSPDGGALPSILTRWLSGLQTNAVKNGFSPDTPVFFSEVEKDIYSVTDDLCSLVNGFDFAKVLKKYYDGVIKGNDDEKESALRWLRGEFSTKQEARSCGLGTSSIIDDANWYDYIKLYAAFFRRIGYKGFIVLFDEGVNLYKIPNRLSRENNYEKILSMFNDTLQGKAEGLGIVLGGTPAFLEDNRRGLFSYEALKSRLEEGRFTGDRRNLISPVIKLNRLSDDELYALVERVMKLHSQYYGVQLQLTEQNIVTFLKICLERMGADEMITPREVIRDFLNILNIMLQDKSVTFDELVGNKNNIKLEKASESDKENNDSSEEGNDDDFFNLGKLEL
ncbi:MAG: ATP-binding protein [Oscillospiraceae bacterium]|nr:ATP-binding protein [Oscillospiraceae bacterium]